MARNSVSTPVLGREMGSKWRVGQLTPNPRSQAEWPRCGRSVPHKKEVGGCRGVREDCGVIADSLAVVREGKDPGRKGKTPAANSYCLGRGE